MNERELEKTLERYLEDASLEDFLEEFNISPLDVLVSLLEGGLIDEEELERFRPTDV